MLYCLLPIGAAGRQAYCHPQVPTLHPQPGLGAHLFIPQILTEKVPPAKSCARHRQTKETVVVLKGKMGQGYNMEWWVLQEREPKAACHRYPPRLWVRAGFLGTQRLTRVLEGVKGEVKKVLGRRHDAVRQGQELQEGRGWGTNEVRWALLDRDRGPCGLSGFYPRATSSRMQNPDVHFSKIPEQSCRKKGDWKRAASHQVQATLVLLPL